MAKDKEKKPQPVIVATFASADAAAAAAQGLKDAQKKKEIAYKAYAVVNLDETKKMHVKETGDVGGIAGLVSGGLLGAVIGIMAGPVGWAMLAGAAVGGVATKLIDSGIKSDEIKKVGESLQPGSSAVIVLADEAAPVEAKLTAAGGTVSTAAIAPEVVEQAVTHAEAEPAPAAPAEEAPAAVPAEAAPAAPAEEAKKE
jgi:uncharacterized membrane protein